MSFDLPKFQVMSKEKIKGSDAISLLKLGKVGEDFLGKLPMIIYTINLRTKENTYSNKYFYGMLGYKKEEFYSKPVGFLLKQIHPEDRLRVWKHFQEFVLNSVDSVKEIQFRIKQKSGKYIWLQSRDLPYETDESGQVVSVIGFGQDITKLKEQELELRISKLLTDKTINSIDQVIYAMDMSGKLSLISNKAEIVFGASSKELIKKIDWLDEFILQKDLPSRRKAFSELSDTGSFVLEYQIKDKNGELKWIQESARLYPDEIDLNQKQIFGTFEDITSKRRAEAQLQESRQIFELAAKASNDGLWQWEPSTGKFYYSDRWKEILGYDGDELADDLATWESLIHPDELKQAREEALSALKGRDNRYISFQRMRHKKGHWVYIISRGFLIRNENAWVEKLVGAITDISDIKKSEEKIRISEEKLKDAQKLAKIGSWEYDATIGKIDLSDSFFEVFGIMDKDLRNQIIEDDNKFYEFVHPEDHEKLRSVLLNFTDNNNDWETEYRAIVGHRIIFISSRAHYVFGADGNLEKILGTIQDITERKMKELELLFAKKEAEDASYAKTQFLNIMSHEIRTPLNAVIGMSYVLLKDKPKPEQIENLSILRKSAEHLLDLINNILDFNKIESGKVRFEEEPMRMPEFLSSVHKSWLAFAQEKGVELNLISDEKLPEFVLGDEGRLTQILNNLINNALKFTEEGSVTIRVEVLENLTKKVSIRFSIEDTGIGIPKSKQNEIFEIFSQVYSTHSRRYGGSGLGLAICAKLLEFQGSKVNVESEEGVGSKFYFDLTFNKVIEANVPNEWMEPRVEGFLESLAGLKVLVVEDNKTNRQVIKLFLDGWKIDYKLAENGLEAVKIVQNFRPDIILMDIQMPIMDGYEASERIRQLEDPYFHNLPIIALTASTMMDSRDRIISSGLDGYIEKPFNPEKLHKILSSYKK